MASKAYKASKKSNIDIDKIVFIGLCILLFYPPFFRGLFFQKELLPTHMLSFTLFAIWVISKAKLDEFTLFKFWADLLGLGIVCMYFLATFYGVNKRLAIAEFLKYANYFVIYLMARHFTLNNDKNKKMIINVLLASGVVVAIIGVGSAIGTFSYNGAFVHGRINSTFQYPNTLAAYLIALFVLSLAQLQISETTKEKYIYGAISSIYIFTFIPTFSRGMWLLAPVVLLAYIVLIPKDKKIETLLYSIITIIPALFLSMIFIRDIENSNVFILWLLCIITPVITSGIIHLTRNKIESSYNKNFRKIIYSCIVLGLIVVVLGFVGLNSTEPLTLSNMDSETDRTSLVDRNISNILTEKEYRLEVDVEAKNPEEKPYAGIIYIHSFNDEDNAELLERVNINEADNLSITFTTLEDTEKVRIRFYNRLSNTEVIFDNAEVFDNETNEAIRDLKLKYKYIPETIIRRLGSITDVATSDTGRMAFYKDGTKVIKDYPIFGAGGGAWQTLYFKYQSYMYWSTQAHNYFLQLWIEIGAIGLLLFTLFVCMLIYNSLKLLKSNEASENKIIEAAVLMAILNILAHSFIDFDLSLGAMAILLWTLFGLLDQNELLNEKLIANKNITKYSISIMAIILCLGSFSLYRAEANAAKGIQAAQQNKIQEAVNFFEKASKYDSFTASYKADLSTIYTIIGQQHDGYFNKAYTAIEKAIELNTYDSKILMKAGQLYLQNGEIDKGLEYIDKAVEVQPMNINNYKSQAEIHLQVASHYIQNEDEEGIDYIANKIITTKELLENTNDRALKPLGYDKDLNTRLQKLNYIADNKENTNELKKLDNIVIYNKFNIDLDKNGVPDGHRIWVWNTENGKLEYSSSTDTDEEQVLKMTNSGSDYGVFFIDNLSLEPNTDYRMSVDYKSDVEPENFSINLYDYTEKNQAFWNQRTIEKSDEIKEKNYEFRTPENIEPGKQRIGIIHRGNGGAIELESITLIEK